MVSIKQWNSYIQLFLVIKANLEEMSEKMSEQQKALQEMKIEMKKAKDELTSSKHALSDVTNKLQNKIKQRDCAHQQLHTSQQNLMQIQL